MKLCIRCLGIKPDPANRVPYAAGDHVAVLDPGLVGCTGAITRVTPVEEAGIGYHIYYVRMDGDEIEWNQEFGYEDLSLI